MNYKNKPLISYYDDYQWPINLLGFLVLLSTSLLWWYSLFNPAWEIIRAILIFIGVSVGFMGPSFTLPHG